MRRNTNTVQSLDRAIMLLEELTAHQDGCGCTYLSSVTGLHKSTVHRILNSLMVRGYIEKDEETDKYLLGMRILYLSSAILDRMDIRKIAKPYLEELCANTGEVVHLSILDEDEAVYIDKVENSEKNIRMYSQVGKRVPLHCTGIGKALLAWLPEKEIDFILTNKGLKSYTPNTITCITKMKENLRQIRQRGYAIDESEHENNIRCVACPIFNINENVIASVSVSGSILNVTKERIPNLVKEVLKASDNISYHLGYMKKA